MVGITGHIQHFSKLEKTLRSLDRKSYGAYKQIKGRYDFGFFHLQIDHVQGDPFALASKLRVFVPMTEAKFPNELFSTPRRAIALRDYLTRSFFKACAQHSSNIGSGKSGLMTIDEPGQQILDRTSCFVDGEAVEMRFIVGLPADGRSILAAQATQMLCHSLPKIVTAACLHANHAPDVILNFVKTYEDAAWLRDELGSRGLCAFVADGSLLPRASGINDAPCQMVPCLLSLPNPCR